MPLHEKKGSRQERVFMFIVRLMWPLFFKYPCRLWEQGQRDDRSPRFILDEPTSELPDISTTN